MAHLESSEAGRPPPEPPDGSEAETAVAALSGGLLRPTLDGITPYEPGKPVEEVQRELGLDHVVKLASNEGPFGPFPAAVEALQRGIGELNRYPDGGV